MEYGLIGERLGHSYSPMIHARLADYHYELREVAPEALDEFLTQRDFCGLNVTIPYKKAVIPHCTELSNAAREVGCVNTLLRRPDGTLYGHNTDLGGFIHMLSTAGIDPNGRKAVILGSGGTSLTARAALRRLGAREIIIVSRSGPVDYDALYTEHADAEILVNTTPVGMYPKNGVCAVDITRLPYLCGVADVVYNPEKTALVLDAEARNIPAVSGLTMLVEQAREAAELFSGKHIPVGQAEAICAEIRANTLNLVLTGMPGCGKSTLGKAVANLLGRPFVDCDAEITKRAGMSIPEIFAKYGEEHFRALESQILSKIGREQGQVIATGGGAIMRPENVRALRQNGRICFVQRNIADLSREGRPLSSSSEAVERLWQERKEIYASTADFIIVNDHTVNDVAEWIKEAFHEATRH